MNYSQSSTELNGDLLKIDPVTTRNVILRVTGFTTTDSFLLVHFCFFDSFVQPCLYMTTSSIQHGRHTDISESHCQCQCVHFNTRAIQIFPANRLSLLPFEEKENLYMGRIHSVGKVRKQTYYDTYTLFHYLSQKFLALFFITSHLLCIYN